MIESLLINALNSRRANPFVRRKCDVKYALKSRYASDSALTLRKEPKALLVLVRAHEWLTHSKAKHCVLINVVVKTSQVIRVLMEM